MKDKLIARGLTTLSQLKLTLNDNDQTNEFIADVSGLFTNKKCMEYYFTNYNSKFCVS